MFFKEFFVKFITIFYCQNCTIVKSSYLMGRQSFENEIKNPFDEISRSEFFHSKSL